MTLMPHQQQALQRLEESSGCQLLNLVPGAGKTLTALTYAKKFNKVLIVCPATITSVWRDESVKWDMPEPILFEGTPKTREQIKKVLQENLDAAWLCIG
jgi:SNF2 family DNA or RNA helicase